MEEGQVNKEHNKRRSGRKSLKKKNKEKHEDLNERQRNPKAFAIQSAVKAERIFRRSQDIITKKHHIPLVDRNPLEPPPIIVAIVGPPKVGKSTLIHCLIKNFTHQNLSTVQGPVTIVSGKKRRLTLMECNNDINSMIDIAKVADLILLLIDASFGFEMETFEFLNICTVHGMPKIMGVLTHLDSFRNNKQLRKIKKRLKHRFWTEIYPGAKLFYLSGMVHGEYQKTEIHNLGRFISVMKFRPLQWRTTHPYLLADRLEDLTDPELCRQQPKCDRSVCMYGYMRGACLKTNSSIHIPGCGDFILRDVSFLPDPCPLPDKQKKRSLNEKEKLIYAPMSGVGGIIYDKDAVYIDLGGSHSHLQKKEEESQKPAHLLVSSIVKTKELLDSKIATSLLSLFSGATPITSEEVDGDINFMNSIEEDTNESDGNRIRRKAVFKNGDVDNNEDDGSSDEGSDTEDEEDADTDTEDEEDADTDDEDEEDADTDDEEGGDSNHLTSPDPKEPPLKKQKMADDLVFDDDSDEESAFSVSRFKKDINDASYNLEDASDNESVNPGDDMTNNENKKKKKVTFNFNDEKLNKKEDDDSGMEEDEAEESSVRWKRDLSRKATDSFYKRQMDTPNLRKLVYGKDSQLSSEVDNENDGEELGGLFRVARQKNQEQATLQSNKDCLDCTKNITINHQDWSIDEVRNSIRDCFVTGKWKSNEDARTLLGMDEEDAMYGDFEDLETGKNYGKKLENTEMDSKTSGTNKEDPSSELKEASENKSLKEKQVEKKRKLKQMFDSEYDTKDEANFYDDLKQEFNQQSQLNKNEFEDLDDDLRVKYEGFRPGMYVRIEIDGVSYEFTQNFDAQYAYILGGLQSGEENIGCVQARMKKHRWYKKILKNRDPLIISLGWRRFQTLPLYSIQDHNLRNRLLKYTPEHLFCHATFWGPITPQGTGFLAVQNVAAVTRDFRIAATGGVVQQDKSMHIMKKLKLTGYPFKIYKKTAFIKDMFHSSLEVTKFEGASIRAVSGIRGQIKKAIKAPEGAFRATFEDRLLLRDVVFVRTWYPVEVPQFYTTLTNLLLPVEEKNKWQGMHTVGQLRKLKGLPLVANPDSIYKPIVRKDHFSRPMIIPKELQKNLPYKDKPKLPSKKKDVMKRIAVVLEPKQRKVLQLMKILKTVHQAKKQKRVQAMKTRVKLHKKKLETNELKNIERQKLLKKRIFGAISRMQGGKSNPKPPAKR